MARRSFISIFRKLLLLALVLTVVAVAGLFLFGRAGRQKERPLDEGDSKARQGTVLIGEDFDYTFTEREKPIFRIRGESIRADEKGVVYLDGVGLTIYDQQGRPYHVESRRATFRRDTNEGQLQGEVFLKGPEGLELRTSRLDLRRKGRLLVAPKEPVEIRYAGKYVVNSAKLQVDIQKELYVLAGGVKVDTLPGAATPGSLTSQRLIYERKNRWLRVEGNSDLRRGADRLSAGRLAAKLSQDEGSIAFVRALQGVTGQTRGTLAALGGEKAGPQPTTINFSGRDLAVVLQPEGNQVRRVELEAAKKGKAIIESTGAGLTRTMRAWRFEGVLQNGVLDAAEAFGGVEIREVVRGAQGGTRQAESQRATAGFRADGQLATADLIGDVIYRDGEMTATGNRGTLDLEAGRGDFVGAPVDIVSPRGRVRAPRVVYNTDQKIIQARGGVRAVLEKASETALSGTPLGQGEGPVTVESQEAFWRQAPTSSFLFRGDVRAWRGKNLLLAPELRGDKDENVLTATGGVKTRWIPDSTPDAAAARPAARPPAKPAAPIEVAANEMVYKDGSGQLIYTGNVRVEQEARTLTCQRLEVELEQAQADEREVETMTCTGDTKLNDPATGRRIEGQKAIYHVAERQMEMLGEPVTMRDREGNVVRGKRLFYFMDGGKVEIKGGGEGVEPAPAASAGGVP
ncbi:MAG TPA: LPS export ABC transporter periplasmic protein LptC [Thermoanaerobaculia bacterium]|nr:LPS export ABC transporter periplasmic protein LptC [Thermoanaerobaculia bacterium]